MSITIGPLHIADATGTHAPGETISQPTDALIELARSKASDPETGLAYAFEPKAVPEPEPEPAPTPHA